MKSISSITDKEKFNKFIATAKEIFSNEDISYIFPRYILYLFYDMEAEDIEDALRGLGSNDEGIDAFFVNEKEKQIYICQFKSRYSFNTESYKEAKKEWLSLLDKTSTILTQKDFKSTNKRVMEIQSLIINDYSDYEIKKVFYHMGFCSQNLESNYSSIEYINQDDILEKFVYFYEKDLDDTPDSVSLEIDLLQDRDFNTKNDLIYFTPKARQGRVRKSLVFPINGTQILSLLKQGSTILDRNVRGYLGDNNSVNRGIINTALKEPEFFYFFNNGISITCDEINIKGLNNTIKRITLVKPQIINGAQTVNSLNMAYKKKIREFKNEKLKDPEKEALNYMKNINVVCKVMESNKSADTLFAKNLTTYNNTQNKIKSTDFYSNRSEQIMLKDGLSRYGIDYTIKRGKILEDKKDNNLPYKVNIEKLAEVYYNQFNLFSSINGIFNEDNEENNNKYKEIFGENGVYNSERILKLSESYIIYNVVNNSFTYVKNIFSQINEIKYSSKEKKEEFINNERKKFTKLTKRNGYLLHIINEGEDINNHIDSLVKNISIMELKPLLYIYRMLYNVAYISSSDDEKEIKFTDYIQSLIKEKKMDKNREKIESILELLIHYSLKVYAKAIDEMLINDKNRLKKKHPKNNEAKNIINSHLNDGRADLEIFKEI